MFNKFKAADNTKKGLCFWLLKKRNMHTFSWKICLGVWILILIEVDFQAFAEEIHSPTDNVPARHPTQDLPDNWHLTSAFQSLDLRRHLDFRESEKIRHHLFRRKRSVFFSTGVKICPDESAEQAIASHLKYFKVRVCQEAVWEVFKTFWDRFPEREEYRNWLNLCEEGTMSILEMGTTFSQSEEHHRLIAKKLSYAKDSMDSLGRPTPLSSGDATTLKDVVANIPPLDVVSVEKPSDRTAFKSDIPDIINDITKTDGKLLKPYHEQMAEFSLLLPEEKYSNELSDPLTEEYQQLSQHFVSEDHVVITERASADESPVSNILPRNFTRPGFIFDIEQVSGNEIWLRPDGLPSTEKFHSTIKVSFPSKPGITVSPDDLLLVDDVRKLHSVTQPVAEAGSSVDSESMSNLSSLEVDPILYLGSEGIPGTSVSVIPLTSVPPMATSSAIQPSIKGAMVASDSKENSLLPDIYIDEYGSGSGHRPQSKLWSWVKTSLKTEASSLYDYTSESPQDQVLSLSPHELQQPLVETVHSNSTETFIIKQLEESSEVHQIISETTAIQLPQTTNQSKMDYITSSFRGTTLKKPQMMLTAKPSAESTVGQQIPGLIDQEHSGSFALEPVSSAESTSHKSADEDTRSTIYEVSAMPPWGMLTASDDFTGEFQTFHSTVTPSNFDGIMMSSSAVVTMTEDSIHVLSDIPATQPTLFQPTVIPTMLEKDLITNVQEVPGQSQVGTTIYSPEIKQEGRQPFMTDSYMELSTSAHPAEMTTMVWATQEDKKSSVTIPGRDLVVFFSLRVTNMMFSEDLFNKNSPDYKALEQQFLELLVPYLQSNLTGFQNLEILNFRNGSIVVNSRLKFAKPPVPHNVTNAVYRILEDFCNTAYQTMNLAVDKYSLDVESGNQADPCKFQACNEFSECQVNQWTGEAVCVCYPGYLSPEGLPCSSVCELHSNFCQNDGKCDIIPGQGAICRCRVGENWWYRGKHCEEYVSEPLVVGITIAAVAGFLLVASTVIFFLARTLREQYAKNEIEGSIGPGDILSSMEKAVQYNPVYESDSTGASHYCPRRYPQLTYYSSARNKEMPTECSSSEEIKHIYENTALTKEKIQERINVIERYAKDRQFK